MTNHLWKPSKKRIESTLLAKFMHTTGVGFAKDEYDYDTLWRHSVSDSKIFWQQVWEFCDIIGQPSQPAIKFESDIRKTRFFPNGTVNYAENLLRHSGDDNAIIFHGEDGSQRNWSWNTLQEMVASIQSVLIDEGVGNGDHVGAVVANTPETVAAMLATASIGAVWSSCSPDFGTKGVLDRLTQISPKMLFVTDGYYYNGRWYNTLHKATEVYAGIPSLKRLIILPYDGQKEIVDCPPKAIKFNDIISSSLGQKLKFQRVSFNSPLFIVFSSGTTGLPKCMVHSVGGTLIQHLKEHKLHCDLQPGDRMMFFTTCGWMMWNWLVSSLASKVTLVLYDGSPLYTSGYRLTEIVEKEKVTHFGSSAKYYDSCAKLSIKPANKFDLKALRAVLSTGSPLSPESYEYIYGSWKSDICLSSISGGTDILGCFAGGCPVAPVYSGECQKRMLGMDVHIYDENGRSILGEPGELVCISPHPSMPTKFINDESGQKYYKAYFDRFENVWTHGDWAELTENKGVIFHGRSDATLNVAGVRIGTSEIYRPVEKIDEILEALIIEYNKRDQNKLVLFVKLRESIQLSEDLKLKIQSEIRTHASPRHVPADIIAVADIPKTKSGKIVELAVRSVVHGMPVKNASSLANPEALDHFKNVID